jgi:hypothetical protein
MIHGHADCNLIVDKETSIYHLSKIFTTAKVERALHLDDIIMRITCKEVRKIIL